jgi:hypothetical protein
VVSNDQLNGYDNGIGSDPMLSGRVWIRYAVALANPLGRGAGRLGRACAVRPASPRRGFGPNAVF